MVNTTTLGLGITAGQTQTPGNLTMAQIQTTIDNETPFEVLYSDGNSGHWDVGIGYINIKDGEQFVVSDNPYGGVRRLCTYNEFLTCGVNDTRH